MKNLLPLLFILALLRPMAAQQASDSWWQDPAVNEWNRLPMRSTFFSYPSAEQALAGKSQDLQSVQSLNGPWKFLWVNSPAQKPQGFWQSSFNDSNWKEFPVPATWERNGFGTPIYVNIRYEFDYLMRADPPKVPTQENPVGSYRRQVIIDPSWQGKEIFLHFGAVKSNLNVWVNGEYVGYSEDSRLPAEFNITRLLRFGQPNLIAFQVQRWSDGTYLECQDMWRVSGVHRDVLLYARQAPLHVADVEAIPDLSNNYRDGLLRMRIALSDYPREVLSKSSLELRLYDGSQVVASRKFNTLTDTARLRKFELSLPKAKVWTAETPNLYKLLVVLNTPSGSEYIPITTGFRKIEIKNGNFLVNGQRVLIKGVNRHEIDPVSGQVISRERMEQDVRIMKELNINTLRTSHYPDDPYIYELANRYGLYVIDEANVESHGMGYQPDKTLGNKPEWLLPTWQRIGRMIERDKNHPCIIMWSMGNEAGNGLVFEECYRRIKKRDASRPVHFEQAELNFNTDVYCPMYPSVEYMKAYATENRDPRPMIMCEYEHAMGNSQGNFKEYWDLIRSSPKLQGGSIWDFVDQAWLEKTASGEPLFVYGGDYGVNMPSDGNFLCNGLVAPDRQYHPHAWEVKYFYQNIWTEPVPDKPSQIEIFNEHFFRDLGGISLRWKLTSGGEVVSSGKLDQLMVEPQQRKIQDLGFSLPASQEELLLHLSYVLTAPDGLLPAGHEVAKQQINLRPARFQALQLADAGPLAISEIGHNDWPYLRVSNEQIDLAFDKKTGMLIRYRVNGAEYLENTFQVRPNFWRPPIDNDYGANLQQRLYPWKVATERPKLEAMESRMEGNIAVVESRYQLIEPGARLSIRYRINGAGEIVAEQSLTLENEKTPMLPRLGMQWILPRSFDRMRWYGRGPYENYSDRNSSSLIDRYDLSVAEQFHSYIRPQETANKTDIRWAELYRADGRSLRFESDAPFNITPKHYLDQDLDEGWEKRNRHPTDLQERELTCVNIDWRQMGLGGTNSWGALPLKDYRLEDKRYQWRFKVTPK